MSYRNNSLFAVIVGAAFAFTGALILAILGSEGILNPKGIVLGVLFGFWICFGYLFGRDVYGNDRRHLRRLLIYMVFVVAVGYLFHFGWQIPYFEAHRGESGKTFVETIAGLLWAASLAVIYLGYRQHRRLEP